MDINPFKGKKVVIIGLGLLGGALNDAIFLATQGADLLITDLKTKEELQPSLEKLIQFKNITYVLGEHRLEDFRQADFIVQPGNVPIDSPFLLEARKNNIPVYVSESLFAQYSDATIVGITGTRGKSTTTAMIFETLNKFKLQGRNIFLGGNVKNVSTLSLLTEVKRGDIAVLELDSWALHGMGEIKKSPHVAVFTTFFDDHLNYYKGDKDLYLEDKAQIFKHQTEKDFLIVGEQIEGIIKQKYGKGIKSKVRIAKSSGLPQDLKLQVLGEHNRYNASCAYETLTVLGLTETEIKKGLEEFKGVSGRLEFVKEVNGIKIYNDTTATTPDATIAALKALGKDKNIVLIVGGADKGLDMGALKKAIPHYVKSVVLLPGTGTDKFNLDGALKAEDLREAVWTAIDRAEPDDILLFSPAFASFGMFKNEFDRGERFLEIVNKL